MCGRYILTSSPSDVAENFDLDVRDNFPPRYNIAPSQPVAVILINEQREKEYRLVRWGFIPEWMGVEKGRPMINARAETVAEKPSFRNAYKRRRCLVPANGFYEWTGDSGARQPYFIRPAHGGLIAFAGIWETVLSDNGSEVDTVATLTISAGPDMREIHHREPVVIEPEDYELWLRADERDVEKIAPLLRAKPKGFWIAETVSTDVNSPGNDGPGLIEPIEVVKFKTDLFE